MENVTEHKGMKDNVYSSKKLIICFFITLLAYFVVLPFLLSLLYGWLYELVPSIFPKGFTVKEENLSSINLLIQFIDSLIIIVFFLIKFIKDKTFFKVIKDFFGQETHKQAWITIGLIYLASFVINLLIPNITTGANQESVESITHIVPILSFFTIVFVGPIIEEIIFRYFLVTPVARKNKYLGIALSGLIFGFVHLINSIQAGTFLVDLPNLLVYAAMGSVLAYQYVKTENLAVTIQGHMVYNCIAFIIVTVL